ncbi:MAG: glycosyltransferase [Spirochaetia bacterium]|nr:glycosyltransferase [Spirochaetia bacterium]
MKIMIVSFYFPPQNAIASLRSYSWAKYWSQMGHEVTVLTALKPNKINDLRYGLANFKIIAISGFSLKKNIENVKKSVNDSILIKIKNQCKLIYKDFFKKTGCLSQRYPSIYDVWAYNAIRYMKKKERNWDIVVSTGGPYSVHRIGYFLKKNQYTKKWIIDWRDLWVDNQFFVGLKIFRPYESFLENRFHERADFITTVSEGLADTLRNKTEKKVEVIYNGFDRDFYKPLENNDRKFYEKITISYTGTLYKNYQTIEPLLYAVRDLYREGKISPEMLEVVSIGGNCDMTDLFEQFGLSRFYTYRGFLPQECAYELQYNSDISLFLDYKYFKTKGILSGKIFEYLYISRIIWSVGGSSESEANHIIKSCNAGICFGNDTVFVKNELLKLISDRKSYSSSREKKYEEIRKYDRQTQAAKMLKLFFDN